MTKTLKLFSLLLIFLFSTMVASDPDPEFEGCDIWNDWTCYIDKNREIPNLPEVGTEVSLVPQLKHPDKKYFVMQDEYSVVYFGSYQGKLTNAGTSPESKQNCFSFVSSESVCLQPARWFSPDTGWFSPAVNRDVIKLSDESEWIAEEGSPIGFKKGDRVIVTQINDSQWGIFDVDQSITWEGRNRKTYAHYLSFVVVKPYHKEAGKN
jgi:hypothetical protein